MKQEINKIKEELTELAPQYNIIRAGFFGSFVRGENTQNSDIDILIDLPKGKTLLDLVAFKQELEKKINRSVDVLTYNSLHPLLKEQILNEQQIIYERD